MNKRDQNADQQQSIGDQVQRKLREEGCQFGHVAVDALDQFTRRVVVVEFHIQMEGVSGQFGAQVVGGCPCDVFAEIGDADCDDLLNQGNADEGNRGPGESLQCFASQRGVDKLPHDLRRKDPQADAAEQQGSQQNKPSLLRADVVGEKIPVGFE